MKKLIIILSILTMSLCAFSQDGVFLVKTEYISIGKPHREYAKGEFVDKITWSENVAVSLMIAIDIDNNIIKIDNKEGTVLKITRKAPPVEGVDDGGHGFTVFPGDAIDGNGVECNIFIRMYDDINIINLYIIYKNIYIEYGAYNPSMGYGERKNNTTGTDMVYRAKTSMWGNTITFI